MNDKPFPVLPARRRFADIPQVPVPPVSPFGHTTIRPSAFEPREKEEVVADEAESSPEEPTGFNLPQNEPAEEPAQNGSGFSEEQEEMQDVVQEELSKAEEDLFKEAKPPEDDSWRDEEVKPVKKISGFRKLFAAPTPDESGPTGSELGWTRHEWLERTVRTALDQNASDLHVSIDSETAALTARIRVDGRLRHFDTVAAPDSRVIMGKLKAATKLSSAGSFAPEEAIYTINVEGEPRKARAVLFRTEGGGEALVMRLPLLGKLKTLDKLSFAPMNEKLLKDQLATPSKMIVIAGPMGSGKTTTAHGALLHVATTERTVWSIEDPVERKLPGMVQLEINEEQGVGFDVLLSKLLRADYDTLFLGEIRDHATAQAAVRQSKAGRQIISTIHANNNITGLLRLIELAKDSPLSVLDSVRAIVSQRLVGRLNPDWDGVDPRTRYIGRVPIHEILVISEDLIEVMMQNKPFKEMKLAADNANGTTFKDDCERLLAAGITDEAEVRRVIDGF